MIISNRPDELDAFRIIPRSMRPKAVRSTAPRAHRGDPEARIYVVAEAEAEKAIDILKVALARPTDEYEDLGRVSDALLSALSLPLG